MKDGALLRAYAMGMIGSVYIVYMVTSAYCTGTVPDGILLGGIAGAVGTLAGYDIARRKAKTP